MKASSFGARASITPHRLMALPPAMQGEGVRLMLERGESVATVAAHLKLSAAIVEDMAGFAGVYRRPQEDF